MIEIQFFIYLLNRYFFKTQSTIYGVDPTILKWIIVEKYLDIEKLLERHLDGNEFKKFIKIFSDEKRYLFKMFF